MIIKIENVGDYVNFFSKTSDDKMLLIEDKIKSAREIFLGVAREEIKLPIVLRDYRSMSRKYKRYLKVRVS